MSSSATFSINNIGITGEELKEFTSRCKEPSKSSFTTPTSSILPISVGIPDVGMLFSNSITGIALALVSALFIGAYFYKLTAEKKHLAQSSKFVGQLSPFKDQDETIKKLYNLAIKQQKIDQEMIHKIRINLFFSSILFIGGTVVAVGAFCTASLPFLTTVGTIICLVGGILTVVNAVYQWNHEQSPEYKFQHKKISKGCEKLEKLWKKCKKKDKKEKKTSPEGTGKRAINKRAINKKLTSDTDLSCFFKKVKALKAAQKEEEQKENAAKVVATPSSQKTNTQQSSSSSSGAVSKDKPNRHHYHHRRHQLCGPSLLQSHPLIAFSVEPKSYASPLN